MNTAKTAESTTAAKAQDKMNEPGNDAHRPSMREAPMLNFAEMFRDPALRRRLKLPKWLYETSYARRDQAALSPTDHGRFICAFNTLIANGTLGPLVDIHGDASHMPHTTQRLLPWHRVYLLQFEKALRAIHPDVSIPYWDWTKASEEAIPPWLVGFTPTVATPTKTIVVIRSPGSAADLSTITSNVPAILAMSDFTQFASTLNGVHGGVHVWVGGAMGSVPTSPADPIFWMHHANLDRLWWQWQNSPQGAGKNPTLSGAAAIMDPWPVNEVDTRDIAALGYSYV